VKTLSGKRVGSEFRKNGKLENWIINYMTEQQALFRIEKPVDLNNKLDDEKYNRDYCFRQIKEEEYLWDMRCLFKPRPEYSKEEVKRQILKWISDDANGKRTYNCGHCVFCMSKLLDNGLATIDEIVDLVLRNDRVKYADAIGTWFR